MLELLAAAQPQDAGSSDWPTAIVGGAIGAIVAWVLAQGARARAAWAEVAVHDGEVREINAQLVVWVDDTTRGLMIAMAEKTDEHIAREMYESSLHGGDLAALKAEALHRFRDREWQARLDLARIRAREAAWHRVARTLRRRPTPQLTARREVEPFLDRWREPVTRHRIGLAPVLDRTRRTTADALAELPSLPLT